jgi:hypothetical protein
MLVQMNLKFNVKTFSQFVAAMEKQHIYNMETYFFNIFTTFYEREP